MSTTIIKNQNASISVVVAADGVPVAVSGSLTAALMTIDGDATSATATATAGPGVGAVVVTIPALDTAALELGEHLLRVSGAFGSRVFSVQVEDAGAIVRSALFVRDVAVARLRRDSLMMAASGALPSIKVSDEYLWDKLRAAESEIGHELRVPLTPTTFFPAEPTPDELTALDGQPWELDPGYDYSPDAFQFNDKWGFIKLRNKPLHSVSRVRFAYPGGPTAHYDLPLDWLRFDKKYGQVQFVPSSSAFAAPLNAFVMQAIGNGRTIPLAIQISYVAGLQDVPANYPELLDAVYKTAAIKILEDAFMPSSGSISADGLSQSMSVDVSGYHDSVDRILNGPKGANGGLMAAIHGIRVGVMGG